MLDWSTRIDDLADYLQREHGIEDRQAVDILLSSLVTCPRTQENWLVLETEWFQRDCEDAWFAFGTHWSPTSLPRIRARFPWRVIEAETIGWLQGEPCARLFVEPDFERYPNFNRVTQAHFALQRSMRIRTKSHRDGEPLRLIDQDEAARRRDALTAATSHAIEDRVGARPADPPKFVPPKQFNYYCELLQKVSPWFPDWQELVKALSLVGVRRAYLYGRSEINADDYAAMARAASDSVPPWIVKALRKVLTGPTPSIRVETAMGLEDKTRRSGHGARHELRRLHRSGVITWNFQKKCWVVVDKHVAGVTQLLNGKIFA